MSVHYAPTRTNGANPDAQKKLNRRLDSYAAARREGIQPATTRQKDIDSAREASDVFERPFNAGSMSVQEAPV